jgi:hypothetical protein
LPFRLNIFPIFSFCQDFAPILLAEMETAPMIEVEIPHAERAFIEETDTPYDVLRVITKLPRFSRSSGFNAEAKDEILKAIAAEIEKRRLQTYFIRWSDSAATTRAPKHAESLAEAL